MWIMLAVLAAPIVWVGAGLVLFALAFALTAVLSLTYRLLARDPHPANDPAAALGTIFPILIGALTFAPFVVLGAAFTAVREAVRTPVIRARTRLRARRRERQHRVRSTGER